MIGEPARWRSYIVDALIETTISRDILLMTRVDKPALLRKSAQTLPPGSISLTNSLAQVNLILFEAAELERPLPRSDRRARHLLQILRRSVGDTFDAGLVNGPRGKAILRIVTDESLTFSFAPHGPVPASEPISLIIGLPRPQTARDILRDATTLGVDGLHFVQTEKGESSYAQSTLWSSGEWRRHLTLGAEQAFDTRIPEVTWGRTLAEAVASFPAGTRLALDNYESPAPLSQCQVSRDHHLVLAIGCERGWAAAERTTLRAHGFQFHDLGPRVLRTETACTVALTLVRAKLGLL